MTEVVGNLRANLGADWADLRTEIQRSTSALGKFGVDFAATAGRVTRAAVGMFAGFSVAGFISNSIQASIAAQEMEAAFTAAFGDSADAANSWADNLAESLGRSNTQVRETATGFQNLFSEITPTNDAAAEASQRFTELAIDFAALKNIRTEDAFRLLQQALTGSTRGVRQYGVDLSAATLRTEALRLGVITANEELSNEQAVLVRASILMREFGDATGEAARQAGGAEEQQEALRARLEETRRELGDALVPALSSVQGALAGALGAFNDFFRGIGRAIAENDRWVIRLYQLREALRGNFLSFEAVHGALARVRAQQAAGGDAAETERESIRGLSDETSAYADTLGNLAGELNGTARSGGGGQTWAERHASDIERLRTLIDPAGEAIRDFAEQMEIAQRAGLELGNASITLARQFIDSAGGTQVFKDSLDGLPQAFRDAVEQMRLEEAQEELQNYRDELKQFANELTSEFDNESGVEERISRINEAFREGLLSIDVYKQALREATGENAREEKLSEFLSQQAEERERAWGRLREAIAGVATGTLDAGEAAKQFVLEWLRAQWIEPFLNRLFSNKGSFGGSGGGFGFNLSGLFSGLFGGGKADGGPVVPGMAYLVGERGRELFVPDQAGSIVPADQTSRMGGGPVINVYTPDANSFRASRRQIAREQRRSQGVE